MLCMRQTGIRRSLITCSLKIRKIPCDVKGGGGGGGQFK